MMNKPKKIKLTNFPEDEAQVFGYNVKLYGETSYENHMAVLSHWLHNHRKDISRAERAEIAESIRDFLSRKEMRQQIDICNWSDEQLLMAAEDPAQYSLFSEFFDVPFPAPENPKFTFIDLFAGIGGFRIALQNMGGECVFSSEFDAEAQSTYFANYGEMPFGDITKIDEKLIPDHDVLCAGFPCQPFSISGKRLGFEDTRGTLFFDIARIAKQKRPAVLFLENVKNVLSHNNGETIKQMMSILDDIGYDAKIKLLNAARYGTPQRRERVYIIGLRKDIIHEKFIYPDPLDLPIYIENILDNDKCAVEEATIHRKDIEFWPNDGHEEYALRPIRVGTVNKGGPGERIYSRKGVGVTLSAYGGGAGAKTGLYKIDGRVRRLTPRECARLQGFPEQFIIPTNRNIAYKQFGNSVSINVLQCIVKSIINTKILANVK